MRTKVNAQELIAKIEAHCAAGGTVYVGTQMRQVRINAKTLAAWAKAGLELMKAGNDGLYIARGKSYDYHGYSSVTFA